MGEFSKVMKQIKRICKANDYKCTDCPMSTQSFCQMSAFDMEGFEAIENIVTAWAADHPEPVYPTWVDWLVDQGLIFVTSNTYAFNFLKATDHIPVDIAQKLGIEPKEG